MPEKPFTSAMNRRLAQLRRDTSPRGKFIWDTVQEDYHNIKNMKDLEQWIRVGSDYYEDN
jgi:hypothetical protein